MVKATENGQPLRLPPKFRLTVYFYDGVPFRFSASVVNGHNCPLKPAGSNRWERTGSCVVTYILPSEQEFEDEMFYFPVLDSGVLTFSDDFKNLTATRSHQKSVITLLFRRKD